MGKIAGVSRPAADADDDAARHRRARRHRRRAGGRRTAPCRRRCRSASGRAERRARRRSARRAAALSEQERDERRLAQRRGEAEHQRHEHAAIDRAAHRARAQMAPARRRTRAAGRRARRASGRWRNRRCPTAPPGPRRRASAPTTIAPIGEATACAALAISGVSAAKTHVARISPCSARRRATRLTVDQRQQLQPALADDEQRDGATDKGLAPGTRTSPTIGADFRHVPIGAEQDDQLEEEGHGDQADRLDRPQRATIADQRRQASRRDKTQ